MKSHALLATSPKHCRTKFLLKGCVLYQRVFLILVTTVLGRLQQGVA